MAKIYDPSSLMAAYGAAGGVNQTQQAANNNASVLDLVNAKMGPSPSRVVSILPNQQGWQQMGMMGGGGGGGAGINLQSIADKLTGQFAQANQANEARYNKLLGLAQQYGQTQRRQNQQLTQQQQASAQQSLTNRGLGNSTIVDSVQQGVARAGQDRQMDIDQRVAEQQSGIIERRTDQGPDLSMYLQLLTRLGALGQR